RGGVPLQQIVASKFVASGQMLRRERSYEGISFQAKVVPVDREVADQFSAAMRAIKDFDKAKQSAIKELNKQLKAEAKAMGLDSAIGEIGVKSTQFTSLMHNCIEQGLLAQKAEATVQEAIQSLQNGQKPVIAVANTMGSFIQAYAEMNEIQNGNVIDISFSDLLARYLERSRDVLIKDYRGTTTRQRLTDAELGEEAIAAYEEALEWIQEGDFSGIPVSPIDYITQGLERAGYSVREVTGRSAALDYLPNGSTTYRVRPESERTSKARINAVAEFNRGDADVIILNCSGSTGISLHASERFADQRPRHMIVAQAERDINVFMQMLGRVHRTGQVALPSYTLLMGDLPAEKRPGAILCRKMAGLNANTTAARETDISITNVVDFMNPYGEQVVFELLGNDLELDAMLDFPLAQAETDTSEIALIKRVTGRIPLLPIAQQESVYNLIESEYRDLVEQQRAMGESILEADQLDLDARTVARMEVIPDSSTVKSEFTGAVYLEVMNVKSSEKPLTQLQVINAIREELEMPPITSVEEHDPNDGMAIAQQKASITLSRLSQDTRAYRQAIASQKRDEALTTQFNEKLEKQLLQVSRILQRHLIGTPVRVLTPNSANIFYGVVAGVDHKARSGSPTAPNAWKLRILVTDAAKQIILPFSKINTGKDNSAVIDVQERDWAGNDVYSLFDQRQQVGRTERQIFTGNLIKAFERHPKGKLVNYTDDQGQVRQGLIMPKGFDIEESLREEPVAFSEPRQVLAFLTDLTERRGAMQTLDEVLTVKAQMFKDGFVLQTPKTRDVGGKYFLDEQLIAMIGAEFYSVGDRMEVIVPPDRIEQVLNFILNQRQETLAVFDKSYKEVARNYLGIELPQLEIIEPTRIEEHREPALSAPVIQEPTRIPESRQRDNHSFTIAPAKKQSGILEKRVARFLEEAGIREAVTAGEDFHLRINNNPYIPLVIERHLNELYLTHYREQNGDLFIDSEMIFTIQNNGQLQFKETAVQDPFRGGEMRGSDRVFAQIFSRNILEQRFAQAAKQQTQILQPNLKEIADQVRDADLEAVAASLGLERDRHDSHKWRDAGHIISIDNSKFMDWLADKGGGGAIDLVMHVQGVDFKEAVQWLSGRSFQPMPYRVQPATSQEPRPLEMPTANEQRWPAVKEYLVDTRRLPEKLVEHLHERNLIYADTMQNAVFVRYSTYLEQQSWQRGEPTGASLRGTWGERPFHGLAQGTSREDGWFWVGLGQGEIQRVLLTESPIDALSLMVLDKPHRQPGSVTIYLSTDGVGFVPVEALRQVLDAGGQVAVAFDADRAGELMAWRLAQELPGVQRIRPALGKDWNERLIFQEQPEKASQSNLDKQRLNGLWKWHRVAFEMGRSPNYL
nr:strawberry notch C-terminal domain-containing protein [Oculatellaceae cyanobacterium Prado106]